MPPRALVADQVFGALLEAVLSGRYPPGEKLPPQRALAADLGVTMTALREALKRLEQMRLVDVRHGDAMRVRDWRAHGGLDVIAHLLFRSGGVDAGVLADAVEARALLMRDVGELAARRATPAQAERLARLAGEVERAEDDAAAQRLDFAFVAEAIQAAGNLVYVLVLNSIRDLYFAHASAIPVTARHEELAPLYARAAAAIGAGDADAAGAAMHELAERQAARVKEAL